MSNNIRPLSPHLQIYRLPMAAIMSITHRLTGIALAFGSVLLAYWLLSVAAGPESYRAAQGFFGGVLGRLLLFVFSFSLFFHLCNGIRHLYWDTGRGFDLNTVDASGRLVLFTSIALTLVSWVVAYLVVGGAL